MATNGAEALAALEEPELSPRELAVRFTDERRYFVSEATVKTHVSNVLAKLHLRDRVQIAVAWYKSGG